jgi:hypothetical protein
MPTRLKYVVKLFALRRGGFKRSRKKGGKANESGSTSLAAAAQGKEEGKTHGFRRARERKLKTHINKINVHGSTCFSTLTLPYEKRRTFEGLKGEKRREEKRTEARRRIKSCENENFHFHFGLVNFFSTHACSLATQATQLHGTSIIRIKTATNPAKRNDSASLCASDLIV